MHRNFIYILLLVGLMAGCASPKNSLQPASALSTAKLFPPDTFVTQRGVLTIHQRQFTLNGYVAKSETRGLRFILTENFGGVLADVLVKPDGKVLVMQTKSPFRRAWVEKYIAVDLKCIFSGGAEINCPVQRLSPTHFIIQRHGYKLDLQTVEIKPGAQPAAMFEEAHGGKP